MSNIKKFESKISDIDLAIEEIRTFGDASLNGKKFTEEDIPTLENLLAKYKASLDKIISEPLTIAYCNRQIKLCHEAMEAVLSSQEYELEGRKLVRADLPAIKDLLDYYEYEKDRLEKDEKPGITVYRITGRDN